MARSSGLVGAGFVAGIVIGVTAARWIEEGRSAEGGRSPMPPAAVDHGLHADMALAHEEISSLRARLAAALAASERAAASADSAVDLQTDESLVVGAGEPVVLLEDRLSAAEKALERLGSVPEHRELFERHSRDEGTFSGWDRDRFTQDPSINPRELVLDADETLEFDLALARARQRVKVIDLRRQLAVAEALELKIEERLAGAGGEPPGTVGDSRVFHLPPGLQFRLAPSECLEIRVLESETKLAVFDWIFEARAFFASLE